jgi:hypothetical protein
MSEISCSTVWNKIKDESTQIDVDWSGVTGWMKKEAAKAAGFTTNDQGIDFTLGKDISKICPGASLGKITGMIKPFDQLTCDGVQKYVSKYQLSQDLNTKIQEICPGIIRKCTPTICEGKASTFELKCEDINKIFNLVLKDPSIIALIQKNLPPGIDLSKEDPCNTAQVIESMGIDVSVIVATMLSQMGINLTDSEYATITKCICPNLILGKKIDCDQVNNIITAVLEQPTIIKAIRDNSGMEITNKNKCEILQSLIDTGVNLENSLYSILEEKLDPQYVPTKEKLSEMIKCICPNLKKTPSPPPGPTPPGPTPPGPGPSRPQNSEDTTHVIYNKINIILVSIVLFILAIIIQVIMNVTNHGLSSRWSNFLLLLIVAAIIIFILIKINYKCLFKACISSGKDWKPLDSKYKGSKSMLGITVSAELEVRQDNTIKLNKLECDGNCPFKNLLQDCKNPNANIGTIKTNYGYALSGPCIDVIYEFNHDNSKIVRGIWIAQNNPNDVQFNIKINVPILGNMIINVPLKKI